jgi:primosomal protein N'
MNKEVDIFRCRQCGAEFDDNVSMFCPACGSCDAEASRYGIMKEKESHIDPTPEEYQMMRDAGWNISEEDYIRQRIKIWN